MGSLDLAASLVPRASDGMGRGVRVCSVVLIEASASSVASVLLSSIVSRSCSPVKLQFIVLCNSCGWNAEGIYLQ